MKEAIRQAKKAAAIGETPVGAVIVHNGDIIARSYNRRETKKCVTAHAEILAIEKASKALGGWRLPDCDLYVTLEPCPMCSGAIIQARINNVYFGAYDAKNGCCGSKADLFAPGLFYYDVNCIGGIMKNECAELLTCFFKNLRKSKKGLKGDTI
ncbi:MAG: nucleoside deaminase [Clostridia bacterium]|nr:nucleoside deaminase [Clostridia bacterium]